MPLRIIKQLAEPPIKSAAFKKRFDKSTKRVRKKIQQYIIDPNEENTHDLRTSIRRFDASFRLMPKKIRNNADVKDLRSHYKKLFKINSEVRDMDVIRFEFSQYPKDTVSSYPNFLQRLQEH